MQIELQKTKRELRIRNYSPKTIKSYLYGLQKYFTFKKINLEKTDLSFNIADEKTCIRPFSFNFDNIKVNMQGYNKNQDINYKIKLEIPESEFKGKSKDVLNNLISQAGKDIKTDNTVKINSSLTGTVKNPILKMAL